MGWDDKKYERVKLQCSSDVKHKRKTPYDYMMLYKKAIREDDFESAKAITEVLKPFNYDTNDTHPHIACIQPPKKNA